MSKSPLSGAFSGSSEPAKKNKKNGAILLIAGIALTSSIGGVFAANSITINSGAAIEFGQGVASTTTCDTGVQTSLSQEYVTGTTFRVDTVTVYDINSAACSSTVLRVSLLNESNTALTTTAIRADATSKTWDIKTWGTVTADLVRKITVTSENQ